MADVSINGLGSFRTLAAVGYAASDVLVFLDSAGDLWAENPFPGSPINGTFIQGIGQIIRLENPDFHIQSNAFLDTAAAYGRIWLTVSDLELGLDSGRRKFYFDVPSKRFHYDSVGYPNNSVPITTVSSANVGDIEIGTRYAVVMFQTCSAYITGFEIAAITKCEITVPGKKIHLAGIPIAPDPQVTKRVIAFTQVGASSAGPYYYIDEDDFIEGLTAPVDGDGNNITKTVIDDNTTTEAFFSFIDEYLIGSVDVTEFADKGAAFNAKSVMFSKTLRRLIWCGEDDDTFRISEPDDPETYYKTTGLNQPAQGDGGTAMCAREFRSELYFFKNNGAHLLIDSSLTPAQWRTAQRWDKVGPEGPWAIDTDKEFLAFAHRSGPYIFDGSEPIWIGYDVSGNLNRDPSWDKINWDYGHKIYVLIDRENQVVKFGVPYGTSTKVNMELIVDYSQGWRKLRWSYDDVATTRAIRVKRHQDVSDNVLGFDGRIKTGQILHGVNDDSGAILYEDRLSRTLNGAPINQVARLGYTPYMNIPGIYGLNAVDVTAGGLGMANVIVHGDSSIAQVQMDLPLIGEINDFDRKPQGLQHERFSVEISNKADLGNFWELMRCVLWVNLRWKTRSV